MDGWIMTRTQVCPICMREFPVTEQNVKYDSDRCRYIALYLVREQAVRMGRDAAIEHYGALFDDPLRSVGKSRYMPHLRHIYAFCMKHQRATFTEAEIAAGFAGKLDYYILGAINRRHDVVHICANYNTDDPSVWRFALPGCKEIMQLE